MLQEQLQQAEVKINELPGFEVVDLHSPSDALSGNLSVVLGGAPYNGRIDVGVVPFGVMGATCIPSLRLGIELKHTEDQKARYKRRQAASEGECMGTAISCLLIPHIAAGMACIAWMLARWLTLSSYCR